MPHPHHKIMTSCGMLYVMHVGLILACRCHIFLHYHLLLFPIAKRPIEQKVQMLFLNLDMDKFLLQDIVIKISMFLHQALDLEGLSLLCQGLELENLPLRYLG